MAKIDDLADLLNSGRTRTTTQRMIEALMDKAGQPNPSLGGALGHGAAAGIMGLIQSWEENKDRDAAIKGMDAEVAGLAPRQPGVPSVGPAGTQSPIIPQPRTSSVPAEALSGSLLADNKAPLSGGGLPNGGIDRSVLAEGLKNNSGKFAQMLFGEGGDPLMQGEATLNRIQARGIPVDQGLLSVAEDPNRGYFAKDTYKRQPPPAYVDNVNKNIIPALLAGSDTATPKLGFTPTGNASGDYAKQREARGVYANSAWPSGVPGKGEMYAQEMRDKGINLPRLPALGTMLGPSIPPPANLAPQPQQTQTAQVPGLMQPQQPVQAPQAGGFEAIPSTGPAPGRFIPQQVPTPPGRAPVQPAPPPAAPQNIPMQPTGELDKMIERYQSATDPNVKAALYKQIKMVQDEMRKREEALQTNDYQMRNKAAVDDAYRQRSDAEKFNREQQLKQTPTTKDLQEQNDKIVGRAKVTEIARNAFNNVLRLSSPELLGMTDPDRNTGFKGGVDNLVASLGASPPGQWVQRQFGTEEQSVRNELEQAYPALVNAMKQSTGMGAKQLDSNVELQNAIKEFGGVGNDKWSNLKAIYEADKKYGTGELAKSMPPEMVKRLEEGAAASHGPQPGKDADGWVTMPNGVRIRQR